MITKPYVNGLLITSFKGKSVIGKSLRENQNAIFAVLLSSKNA